MPVVLQWIVIGVMALLVYFGYIHGAIKHVCSGRVKVGMTEKEVKRLIGNPIKKHKHGNRVDATYKFHYANRLSAGTDVTFRVTFENDKVVYIYK